MLEDFAFLDSWRVLLPRRFPCVLAVAGQGAKTTLLERLSREYREGGASVLRTRSAAGPAAPQSSAEAIEPTVDPGEDLHELARRRGVDVVLVEAQSSCGSLVWPQAPAPRWPRRCDLAFGTANLQALGRLWTAEVVHEAPDTHAGERRVEVADLLAALVAQGAREGRLETGTAWIPFLSGFASLRDMDAMFTLGQELFRHGARIVCFGELLGDPRRDEADRLSVAESVSAETLLRGERIYAIHADPQDDR